MHESGVRETVQPGRGIDADDPEAAHVAFAGAPVPVGIGQGAHERLMGALVEAIVGAVVALDLRQDLLVTLVRGDAALDASHGSRSLLNPAVSSGPLTPGVDTPRAPPCGATPGRRPRRHWSVPTLHTAGASRLPPCWRYCAPACGQTVASRAAPFCAGCDSSSPWCAS